MAAADPPTEAGGPVRIFHWRRLRVMLLTCLGLNLLMLIPWQGSPLLLTTRRLFVGLFVLLAFGLFERWPAHLPQWLARWV